MTKNTNPGLAEYGCILTAVAVLTIAFLFPIKLVIWFFKGLINAIIGLLCLGLFVADLVLTYHIAGVPGVIFTVVLVLSFLVALGFVRGLQQLKSAAKS